MSAPETEQEHRQAQSTSAMAGPAENLVSTACPACKVRFAMLASLKADGWHLRCVLCGHSQKGELK